MQRLEKRQTKIAFKNVQQDPVVEQGHQDIFGILVRCRCSNLEHKARIESRVYSTNLFMDFFKVWKLK